MSRHRVRMVVRDDLERSRLTVGLRLILAIPLGVWLALWSIAAMAASILNWLATLALGRSPGPLHRFMAAYLKFTTQFYAYLRLAANPYPPFDGGDGYPIDLWIGPPERQGRLGVLLRLPLALPAIAIGAILAGSTSFPGLTGTSSDPISRFSPGGLAGTVSILGWFAILARGRMPRGLRDAAVYGISYGAQLWAYLLLLTDRYPDSDPMTAIGGLPLREDPIRLSGEDDLRRSRLTVLFRLPLSFPHLLWLFLWFLPALVAAIINWLATLALGRSPAPLHRFLASYLRYQVSVYAFMFLVANPFPGFTGAPGGYPLDALIAGPVRQSRWGVLFRLLLGLPALLILGVYSSLAWLLAIFGWCSSLVRGRMPRGMRNAAAMALRYQAQTLGYLLLLTPSYPYSGPCRSVPEGPRIEPAPDPPRGLPPLGLEGPGPPPAAEVG